MGQSIEPLWSLLGYCYLNQSNLVTTL